MGEDEGGAGDVAYSAGAGDHVEPSVEVDLVVRPLLLGLHAYAWAARFVRVSARIHLLGKIKADCPDLFR